MNVPWIFGSYLLVSGGFILSTLLLGITAPKVQGVASFIVLLAFWAGGAFAGGYLAGRASEGKTIAEPAIGAVLFIASLFALFTLTEIGTFILQALIGAPGGEGLKFLGMIAGAFLVGGLLGAALGEKAEAKPSGVTLSLLAAFMVLGGIFVGLFVVGMIALRRAETGVTPDMAVPALGGVALGALVGGFGAARAGGSVKSTAGGSLLTGLLFFAFARKGGDNAVTGAAVLLVGILICATIGALIGRRRAAPALDPKAFD
jgi:hypothetical protein